MFNNICVVTEVAELNKFSGSCLPGYTYLPGQLWEVAREIKALDPYEGRNMVWCIGATGAISLQPPAGVFCLPTLPQ